MAQKQESPGAKPGAISTTTTSTDQSTDSADYIRGLRRRRSASWRIPPLVCGHVDPWTCTHRNDPTEAEVDGAVNAAKHLRSVGLVPMFPEVMCRAMYRKGYRELATELGSRWTA